MSRGLYSDPFLKALIENEPKLANEFLEAIANTEYVKEAEVTSCIDVPGWVLEKAGLEACKNPNFPTKKFEEFLADEALVVENFWKIFEHPHLRQEQINKLMKSMDVNVRGLALAHPLGNSSELLEYLKLMISEKNTSCYVIDGICRRVNLSDEVFSYLFGVHDHETFSRSIGQALWDNPTLSEEQKAALVLTGIQPKDDSASTYWGNSDLHFISSIPYFQSLKTTLEYSRGPKLDAIPPINKKVEDFFSKSGHHLSVVLPADHEVNIEVSVEGLQEFISLELLHRLFWTDLCARDDFEIYRRNAYRTDDLFISHPILGRDFEQADADNATQLGGVFIYNNQNWLRGDQELPVEQAVHELRAYEESLSTIVEEGDYEHLGETLIALTYELPELTEKYGFEVTELGEEWMIAAAMEFAEPDSFDVYADLNPDFGEMLSYRKISDAKKLVLFNFLQLGYMADDSKLRNDCIHFLGCMALSGATPDTILKQLKELNHTLITEVLKSRTKCTQCDAEIGSGLCLKCNLENAKKSMTYSDDEADEIYSRGLDLAKNGEKYEALEVWLPLAMSGDATTIGAVIATLWRMDKVAEAKTWIVRLAEIDLEGLETLAGRLDVPFSEFQKYATEGNKP
jgi:hypothetical protein